MPKPKVLKDARNINIELEPHHIAILATLANEQKQSRLAVIRDMLDAEIEKRNAN